MKKILYGVIGVIVVIILFSMFGGNDSSTSNSNSEPSKKEETKKYLQVGETGKSGYFEVTINSVEVVNSKKIDDFESLKAEKDSKYLIINMTFKNVDKESRTIFEGSVYIDYNGTKYEYDHTETFLVDGWGVFFDKLNPLTSKTTNIVYKIPAEIAGEAVYKTGSGVEFNLGTIK